MHKKLLVGACALGIAVPVLAAEKPWFAAGIDTYIDWPTDGTDKVIEEVGTWSNTAVAGLAGDDAKYLAITNAEQALTFTAETAQSLASVDAKFVSAVKYTAFELEDLPEIPGDAKAGLTVAQDSEGNLTWRAIRYNADESANEWVVLNAESVPATTSTTVTVSVKMSATRVSYAVNGASLTDDQGGSDFPLAPGAETLSVASYQGIGEVASLEGKYEGAPWEGAGTEENPYQIGTPEDLLAMAEKIGNYGDKCFLLTTEIDMTDVAWSGIGTEGNPFTGTFDGGSATISGLGGALFAYATDATIKNLTVNDAPFVGTAAGTITFAACMASVTVETPAYGYAYVLAGADGASVVFDESESPNFGPTMLKPVPEDVALMEKMRYGQDIGGGFVRYLIGAEAASDPIYADLDYNSNVGPYLLLHNVDNSQYTVVDLWEEGQSVAFDTALAGFLAPDPVGIDGSMVGQLWIAKSTEGTVTTYSTTTEEPAPEAYEVEIHAADNTTAAKITYNGEEVEKLEEAYVDDEISVTFEASEHYTLSGEATITITVSEEILADGKVVIDGPEATPIVVTSVTLDKAEATLKIEETLTLVATVTPEDALETTVTWTSDNDSVATVDEDGVVTAVAAGEATITAACGDVSATCTITVEPAEQPLPGEDLIPEAQKSDYKEWALANGVTADTTVAPNVLAVAFLLEVNIGAYETIEAAAQAKVDTLVPQIDMSKVIAGELADAVDALNTALESKGLKASLVPVTELKETPDETSGFYKLQISLATEN